MRGKKETEGRRKRRGKMIKQKRNEKERDGHRDKRVVCMNNRVDVFRDERSFPRNKRARYFL